MLETLIKDGVVFIFFYISTFIISASDYERPDISGPIQSIKMYSCIQCAM